MPMDSARFRIVCDLPESGQPVGAARGAESLGECGVMTESPIYTVRRTGKDYPTETWKYATPEEAVDAARYLDYPPQVERETALAWLATDGWLLTMSGPMTFLVQREEAA